MLDIITPLLSLSGGCASFGHSCYGGHGKRSQQGVESLPQDTIRDKDLSRHSGQTHDIEPNEQFSSIYDAIGKPENDIKSLLRKLVSFLCGEFIILIEKFVPRYICLGIPYFIYN